MSCSPPIKGFPSLQFIYRPVTLLIRGGSATGLWKTDRDVLVKLPSVELTVEKILSTTLYCALVGISNSRIAVGGSVAHTWTETVSVAEARLSLAARSASFTRSRRLVGVGWPDRSRPWRGHSRPYHSRRSRDCSKPRLGQSGAGRLDHSQRWPGQYRLCHGRPYLGLCRPRHSPVGVVWLGRGRR
jgi:hypothetical protein